MGMGCLGIGWEGGTIVGGSLKDHILLNNFNAKDTINHHQKKKCRNQLVAHKSK